MLVAPSYSMSHQVGVVTTHSCISFYILLQSHSVALHSQQAQSTSTPKATRDFIVPMSDEPQTGDADLDILGAVSRKAPFLTDSSYKKITLGVEDPDGPDKYKRRSALSWLRRWIKYV